MDNTALDQRLAEHLPDPFDQRLGAIQYRQDRPGHRQAPLAQVGQQVTDQGGVLGRPWRRPTGCLRPSAWITNATTHSCSAKLTPSTRIATGSIADRSAASSSASAVWVRRRTGG